MADVTEEQIEEYQRDGAVVLKNIFTDEWIELIQQGIDMNIQSPSQYSEWLTKVNENEGRYFNDYCNWLRPELWHFRRFVENSPAAQIAGRLMKSNSAVFYHEHVLYKEPGTLKETPWHQDQPYYPVNGFQNCSLWMPLDDIDESTTVRFVRGSHRWGKMFRPRYFATETNYIVENEERVSLGDYEDCPVDDIEAGKWDILQWAVKPGDCVAFHMLTVHGAPGNMSRTRKRRVLSTRWLGDDATLVQRPWKVSPPIMGGLKYGQRIMNHLEFPLIWQQQKK